MSLFFAELRKVWGSRLFPLLLAVLAAANLLLLWMGTRPTTGQPPAAAYRAVGAQLDDLTMEEKGAYLHGKYTEIESLVKIGGFYRDMAYAGSSYLQAYRDENAAMFDAYEQEYKDKSYTLFTDDLNTEYRLFNQLQNEYDTVAAYTDFLDGVQTKATQLAGISIFQNDKTGYDLKNIEATAKVYAGLTATEIDYYPQKGLYTAISYAFTDLILLASMLLLALILVRQERDSGLLGLVRSLPGGRLKTALAKLAAFAASLLVVLTVLYGAAAGWIGALALPLAMYGVRAAIPATSHFNVVKYANLVSLLQTNELLGNYRNLFWFGTPIGLPFVEWTAARTAAARRQARPCVGADAQDESNLCYKRRGPQAVCAERRGSVPSSVLGVRRVSGRDERELHRRRRNLLCLLHEAYLRPVDGGEPRLVDCTGRGVCPDAGRTAARGARRAEQRGNAGLRRTAAEVQYLPAGRAKQYQLLLKGALRRVAGVRERLQKVVRLQRYR